MIRFTTGVTLLLLLSAGVSADVLVDVEYGFGGQAVSGAISPLSIRVKSMEATRLTVQVEAGYTAGRAGGENWVTVDSLSPSGEKVFRFYGRGSRRSTPKVVLTFDREVAVVQPDGKRFKPSDKIEVKLPDPPGYDEDSPAYLQILAAGPQASLLPDLDHPIRVLPVEEADLPDVWHAYDGIDVVLLRNPAEKDPLEPAVQTALLEWVEAGGRLVISATRRPDLIADTPLGRALPARIGPPVDGGVDYVELAGLLAERRTRIAPEEQGPLVTLHPAPGATSRTVPGLAERDTVLWAESRYGLGSIILLAFDSSRFARTYEREGRAVLGLIIRPPPRPTDPGATLQPLFEDFLDYDLLVSELDYPAGILRLLKTGSLKPPPMFLLSLFMILYVLAIGPFDYVFLKRRRKLSWSAASLILLAVGFSALAWFTSFYLFAGSTRVNRFTFVDVAPRPDGAGTDNVIVNDMAGHYEPRGGAIELDPTPWDTAVFGPLAEPEAYLQWASGLPGDTFTTRPVRAGVAASTFRIPFRSLRSARALLRREEAYPLDVGFVTGESVSVRNDLDYELQDAHLLVVENGKLNISSLGSIPPKSDQHYVWKALNPGQFARRTELKDAGDWTPELFQDSDTWLPALGRTLLGLSVSGSIEGVSPSDCGPISEKLLRSLGIDRTEPLRSGSALLLGWTSHRDPFGLGIADEEGFTITVIRRWIEP